MDKSSAFDDQEVAKAVILRCLEAAPGKTLVLDKLRQAFKNEVGFDLNVKDLAKHTSYRGRGSLGQFLKSIPEVHRPDPNTVALKRVDKSSAFDDQEVEKEVSLKPLAIRWTNWEDEPVAAPGAAPTRSASLFQNVVQGLLHVGGQLIPRAVDGVRDLALAVADVHDVAVARSPRTTALNFWTSASPRSSVRALWRRGRGGGRRLRRRRWSRRSEGGRRACPRRRAP